MSSSQKDTKTRILEATWRLMEQSPGQETSMGAIAKAAGISRQAVYLHFASRTKLLIETLDYVDEVKGLDERLALLDRMAGGAERLDASVEIWGNYIPEIIGVAKTLLQTREGDEAMAAAWHAKMNCLREVCRGIIDTLLREGLLPSHWSPDQATEIFLMTISINNWEQLVQESGWSQAEYIDGMKKLLRSTLIERR
jgi:AcrR family transcriptional regulator